MPHPKNSALNLFFSFSNNIWLNSYTYMRYINVFSAWRENMIHKKIIFYATFTENKGRKKNIIKQYQHFITIKTEESWKII